MTDTTLPNASDSLPQTKDWSHASGLPPMDSTNDIQFRLMHRESVQDTQLVSIAAKVLAVGSHPGAQVTVIGDGIAAEHCEIHRTPAGTFVRDLCGETCVNGKTISEQWLQEGDKIQLGPAILQIESLGAVAVEKRKPAASHSSETETDQAPPNNR